MHGFWGWKLSHTIHAHHVHVHVAFTHIVSIYTCVRQYVRLIMISSSTLSRIRSDGSNLIKDRKYHLATYKQAFVAREFVDWLISRGEASSRIEAVEIGRQLLDAGVFRHGELTLRAICITSNS